MYYRDGEAAARTVAAIVNIGRRAVAIQADVGDEHAVEAAFDACAAQLGIPDILVNSAGLNQSGVAVVDMELAQWQRLLASDLTGPFLTSRRFVRNLKSGPRPARIVNISSIHAEDVRAGAADYCAAKAGLQKLTETMALECASLGITVNAVAPGMILTPMNLHALEDTAYRRSLEANIPVKRAGTPEEVAAMVVYLVSPAAAYVTGATMTIDGGLSLVLAQGA